MSLELVSPMSLECFVTYVPDRFTDYLTVRRPGTILRQFLEAP
jgi:hypothetical protein